MWDLLRPGTEPVSPALAGEFLTAAPPGKSSPPYLTKTGQLQIHFSTQADYKEIKLNEWKTGRLPPKNG